MEVLTARSGVRTHEAKPHQSLSLTPLTTRESLLIIKAHGVGSNHRPLGYEPSALTTALPCVFLHPDILMTIISIMLLYGCMFPCRTGFEPVRA